MWFQRAFIASRGSSVIAVAMDQDDRIDTILNIFLTVKRNILEYCLDNRRMDSKYIASIREGLCEAFQIILQLPLVGLRGSSQLQNTRRNGPPHHTFGRKPGLDLPGELGCQPLPMGRYRNRRRYHKLARLQFQ